MRTIDEIKRQMTAAYMADKTVRERYGLTGSATFEETFSKVSIESILFYVVASAIYVVEALFDRHKKDVEGRISTAVLASLPWYHKVSKEFQYGDDLRWNEKTSQYEYITIDESKQKVKFVACKDMGGGVRVLASAADSAGNPEKLSDDVLMSFKHYLNRRKPAGVILDVYSYESDKITLKMSVQYNPLVLNNDGSLITNSAIYPVEEAAKKYLAGIVYGGTFNKTALVDRIQAAEGVVDVVLEEVRVSPADEVQTVVKGNNYTSKGGSFEVVDIKGGINYVLSV